MKSNNVAFHWLASGFMQLASGFMQLAMVLCIWQALLCSWQVVLCSWQVVLCSWQVVLCSWQVVLCSWQVVLCSWQPLAVGATYYIFCPFERKMLLVHKNGINHIQNFYLGRKLRFTALCHHLISDNIHVPPQMKILNTVKYKINFQDKLHAQLSWAWKFFIT